MQYFETKFLAEADKFIAQLEAKAKRKVFYNIDLAEQTNDPELFKKLKNEIWEFRVRYMSQQIRIMAKNELKAYSLKEMKDKYIGTVGTPERDEYEHELRMDVLGRMIKKARQQRNLTQEQLGVLVGVQKAQISKIESNANSATIDTILKVFKALKAEIHFKVSIENQLLQLS